MGTHGHRGFNHLMLGSVTESIIHQAVCPVLVVSQPKQALADPAHSEGFRTILLATDFSTHSDRALAYALKWGSEWGARVVLFHAVQRAAASTKGLVDLFPEYKPYFHQQVAGAWETIRDIIPKTAEQSCDVACEVRHGNPKEEILRVAEEQGADLIVTGARGTGGADGMWGSVSSAIVRDGRYPVLVVRDMNLVATYEAIRNEQDAAILKVKLAEHGTMLKQLQAKSQEKCPMMEMIGNQMMTHPMDSQQTR
jgi:universal stress protein A